MAKKIEPRYVLDALQEILTNHRKAKRGHNLPTDTALWIGRAQKMIRAQAVEIHELKSEQLAAKTEPPQEPQPEPPQEPPQSEDGGGEVTA